MAVQVKENQELGNILNFFPKDKRPRQVQIDTLLKIEEHWNTTDVIAVNLEVASGKSAIAMTLARWAQKTFKQRSAILTPTNILVDQYTTDYPGLHTLKRQDSYTCSLTADHDIEQQQSCKEVKANLGRTCKGCHYSQALKKTFVYPYGVYNYYTYLAYKIYPDILIVDEAHNLLPMIQSMAAKRYWYHQYNFPAWIDSYGRLRGWLESNPLLETDTKLQTLYGELTNGKARFLVQKDVEPYRGIERPVLKLVPIDVRDQPPLLWPLGKVKKIILLSATINRTDIEELGLDKRRVRIISAPSPIPAENRPVEVGPCINLSFRHQAKTVPEMAQRLLELLARHPEKGFVHAPYGTAALLKKQLEGTSDRWLFHDNTDKSEVFDAFLKSPTGEGKVLIASGMYEGVDLKEDIARWQVIAKVPWPSLAEPAIAFKAEMSPEWYNWETAKQVIQAVGRVCRTPTDYGITYIWDSTFERLYNENPELFSDSFKQAVRFNNDEAKKV